MSEVAKPVDTKPEEVTKPVDLNSKRKAAELSGDAPVKPPSSKKVKPTTEDVSDDKEVTLKKKTDSPSKELKKDEETIDTSAKPDKKSEETAPAEQEEEEKDDGFQPEEDDEVDEKVSLDSESEGPQDDDFDIEKYKKFLAEEEAAKGK